MHCVRAQKKQSVSKKCFLESELSFHNLRLEAAHGAGYKYKLKIPKMKEWSWLSYIMSMFFVRLIVIGEEERLSSGMLSNYALDGHDGVNTGSTKLESSPSVARRSMRYKQAWVEEQSLFPMSAQALERVRWH